MDKHEVALRSSEDIFTDLLNDLYKNNVGGDLVDVDEHREELAELLKKKAVIWTGSSRSYETMEEICAYLRHDHQAIVEFRGIYYFYAPHMSVKTMPCMRIEDVNTEFPWTIIEDRGGYEEVVYLEKKENNFFACHN